MKNTDIQSFEETSVKKYPYNKYFQYKDEDRSIAKNLDYEVSGSYRGVPMYDDEDDKENLPSASNNILKPVFEKKHNDTFVEFGQYIKGKEKNRNKKCKKTFSSCNQSVSQTITSNRQKKSLNKTKLSTSKMESKRKTEKSKTKLKAENDDTQELKYYKKLCLDMRKKNCELSSQLKECKQKNRQSLVKLQKKVQKISEGHSHNKKVEGESHRLEKIFENLRSINGKLHKKSVIQIEETSKYKKFYDFFTQSLTILDVDGQFNQKTNVPELQLIWKQILQFLIMNNFKLEDAFKGKYPKKQ